MTKKGGHPLECDTCGKTLRTTTTLIVHKRIHTGSKPYPCDTCGKRFRQLSNLIQHQRIHSGEKPYKCKICGKTFHQQTHLNNHVLIHEGKKPYHCEICLKSGNMIRFRQVNNFNYHMGRYHRNEKNGARVSSAPKNTRRAKAPKVKRGRQTSSIKSEGKSPNKSRQTKVTKKRQKQATHRQNKCAKNARSRKKKKVTTNVKSACSKTSDKNAATKNKDSTASTPAGSQKKLEPESKCEEDSPNSACDMMELIAGTWFNGEHAIIVDGPKADYYDEGQLHHTSYFEPTNDEIYGQSLINSEGWILDMKASSGNLVLRNDKENDTVMWKRQGEQKLRQEAEMEERRKPEEPKPEESKPEESKPEEPKTEECTKKEQVVNDTNQATTQDPAQGTTATTFQSEEINDGGYSDGIFAAVERVLDERIRNGELEFLVKWEGFTDDHNDWVKYSEVSEWE